MQPTCCQCLWTHLDRSNPQQSAHPGLSVVPVPLMGCMNSSTACKQQIVLAGACKRHDALGWECRWSAHPRLSALPAQLGLLHGLQDLLGCLKIRVFLVYETPDEQTEALLHEWNACSAAGPRW